MQSSGKLVLTMASGHEQEYALSKASIALGRAATNDIVIRDAQASRDHARLECGKAGCTIIDLGSANGTLVNDVRVERKTITPGDVITIGTTRLRFEVTALHTDSEPSTIDSEAALNVMLSQATLSISLNNTQLPRLAVHTAARTWETPFSQDALTIGRGVENDIVIDDPKASRRHALIERKGNAFLLRDLNSKNGTWFHECRVTENLLQDSDAFRIGTARLIFKRGFETADLTLIDQMPISAKRLPRRPIVVVPGFMGSELWRGSERIWPNVNRLFRHPEVFRLPDAHAVEARGLVSEVVIVPNLIKLEEYRPLVEYLSESLGYESGKDLLEFGYDWRQDVRHSARRLAQAIEQWNVKPPITIIAHSLGCLVSRYYVECLGGKSKVGRLILMGGPHQGVPKSLTNLAVTAKLLPFGLMGDQLRQVLVTFPSMYQILPTYPCALDQTGCPIEPLKDETWLEVSQRGHLRNAREFRKELGAYSNVPTVSIFGYGIKTATKLTIQRDHLGLWHKVDIGIETRGDSTIPETSAIMEGSEIHPVQQYHGSLYVDNDVKMRLKLELTR